MIRLLLFSTCHIYPKIGNSRVSGKEASVPRSLNGPQARTWWCLQNWGKSTALVLADVPGMINYQGIIVDENTGDPLPGEHTVVFRIYDSSSGCTLLWSEEQQVTADDMGVFSTIAGSESEIAIAFDNPGWPEVEVDTEVLLPRRPLVSVPYAFRSERADDADSLGGVHSGDYVVQGETGVVTSDMIADGAGSDLDADMLDGLDSDAFADSGHNHDDRYYLQEELDTTGSINDTGNPVDWTRLKNVPAGFADGTDDTGPGDGHSLDASDGSPVDAVYVNPGGNVGIGTTSPDAGKLQVESAGDAVYAKTTGGKGIFAVAGSAVGGESDGAIVGTSSTMTAVRGYSTNSSGVYGQSSQDAVPAIHGEHTADGPAIYGGCSGYYPCVEGLRADDGVAVAGLTNSGIAVYGHTSSNEGVPVVGIQTGYTMDDISALQEPGGYFGGKNGVIGLTKELGGFAVCGFTLDGSGWAGYFSSAGNGVAIDTPGGKIGLTVAGGTKNALVATADGARSLYCEEASEVWFADYGFDRLEEGAAVVSIDPVFAQTVNLVEPYHVFLQAYGNADLYVASRTPEIFEVRLREGDPEVEFSYRLVAKRLGYEGDRLSRAPWADNNTNLFPGKAPRRQGQE